MDISKSVCFFCHDQCGVLVESERERLIGVKPDRDFVFSACQKTRMSKEFHLHPDRLNYPHKRAGNRGEGKWERITWDQALDEIAQKLAAIKAQSGAEAVCLVEGDTHTDRWAGMRFMNLFGSPNHISPAVIDLFNKLLGHWATYGCLSFDDVIPGTTKCMVNWGGNPAVTRQKGWKVMRAAQKKGAKLISIDPRYTETAKVSDFWLQIRPGTDCALALAWLNVIISEELYDKEFVEKYTLGFAQIKECVKNFTPEKAEKITWIPAEKIAESARTYSADQPSSLLSQGLGADQIGRNMLQLSRAQCILRSITGNLDLEGGELLAPVNKNELKVRLDNEMELNEKLSREQRAKQLGADRFRLQALPGFELCQKYEESHPYAYTLSANAMAMAHWPTVLRAILKGRPYPVKGMIAQATNPLLWLSNSRLVYQGLKALDLLVVMDYFLTPTAMLADYVLPATDWLERPVFVGKALWNVAHGGKRSLKPEAERRDDYQLWRGLGTRLGQAEYWWDTLEEAYGYRVEPAGYASYEEFVTQKRVMVGRPKYRKYEQTPFATPSGKIELYSGMLEQLGYNPLPQYEEPAESPISTPALAKEYPYILITGGKIRAYYHSEFRQIVSARRKHPDPLVQINPDTAQEFGIIEGDWVTIETPLGSVKQRAKVDPGIDPRVIHAEHGWWFPEDPGPEPSLYGVWKSNINAVIDDDPDKCDPACGSWPYRAMLCKIYK
jgi:thiosulfate reductase/polysulfide reductase chain A